MRLDFSRRIRCGSRRFFGDSKQDIAKKLTKFLSIRMDGTFVEPSRMRLSTLLERWVKDAARSSIPQSTYYCYKGIIKNHIDPRIGGTTLAILNPVHIQRLYADMERNGVGPRVDACRTAPCPKAGTSLGTDCPQSV